MPFNVMRRLKGHSNIFMSHVPCLKRLFLGWGVYKEYEVYTRYVCFPAFVVYLRTMDEFAGHVGHAM